MHVRWDGEFRPIATTPRRGDHSSLSVHSDSRAATCQETVGGAPVDGGFRQTRVVVTELKPAFHARTIHAPDCSYVSRTLVG